MTSGAAKRRKKKESEEAKKKLPKIDSFFGNQGASKLPPSENIGENISQPLPSTSADPDDCGNVINDNRDLTNKSEDYENNAATLFSLANEYPTDF